MPAVLIAQEQFTRMIQVIDANTWGNDAVVLNASGTVYFGAADTIGALTPSGGSYTYGLLHKFSGKYDYPNQLTIDSSGTLYGATTAGGGTGCAAGCGFYFKLTP